MELSVRLIFPELPDLAERAPHRSVYVGDGGGICQVFATDARSGVARQVTDRPQGTVTCAIEPDGELIWWFDDDLTGVGSWRLQPFEGGPDRLSGVPAGRLAGLAMTPDGTVAVGVADELGVAVHLRTPSGPARQVLWVAGYAQLVDIAGGLLAISGEPDAPDAVRVYRCDGTPIAQLSGVDGQVWALGLRPGPGPATLLLVVEAGDGYRLATWSVDSGLWVVDFCDFDTEITASWYPDGRRVLVRQNRLARSVLFELDLVRRTRSPLPTPAGSILAAAAQVDGRLRYVWTAGSRPPEVRTGPAAGSFDEQEPSGCVDVWTDGPGGAIHALLVPGGKPAPGPAVFLLHGGPFEAAMDAYDPLVNIFTSVGCTVVRVNYRGSTGYGPSWRRAFDAGVGLTQLADVAAVRRELVRTGVVDPARTAVAGESWGGYLALLAAGVQSDLWCGVAAVSPIADYRTAFQDTTAAVRALDVRLFGGTPEEIPDAYARSSPITYAEAVRAPILLVAGADDAKCPPSQIRTYVDALRRYGRDPEVIWTGHGHQAYDVAGRIETLTAVVRHVGIALGGQAAAPAMAPAAARAAAST